MPCVYAQTDVAEREHGLVDVQLTEMMVGNINLRFLDRKTGEAKEGATRPDVILRHISTRPGQV